MQANMLSTIDPLCVIRKVFDVKSIRAVPWIPPSKVIILASELGRWKIASSRNPLVRYEVIRKGYDIFTCDCLGHIHHGHCKHVESKRKQLGLK